MAPHQRRPPADTARLSMWTVIGAVAASVLTAGILGSVSGILQVPTISNEVAGLRASRDQTSVSLASLSERVRSSELVAESEQRELNDIVARIGALSARIDKQDYDTRAYQIEAQKEIASLEGRSKDRNTEAMGAISTLRSSLDGQGDRIKALQESINAVRQNVYDLATRLSRLPASGSPQPPLLQNTLPSGPPFDQNNVRIAPAPSELEYAGAHHAPLGRSRPRD